MSNLPVPTINNVHAEAFNPLEKAILSNATQIELWFRKCWHKYTAPLTSSVDLRHAGFKIVPVDTNLFPAGFNNLNVDFSPLGVQAFQAVLEKNNPDCANILILPELHTRNTFYLQSLGVLRDILVKAGFTVRVGNLDTSTNESVEKVYSVDQKILFEPLIRDGNYLKLHDFMPDIILLNNDLSSGMPTILHNLIQSIQPTALLGWSSRYKSSHFNFYTEVTNEFAQLIQVDPWLLHPLFSVVEEVNFMSQVGLDVLSVVVDDLLGKITAKYTQMGIKHTPFVVVKADNGTYGMGVMMVRSGSEIENISRKQRKRMSTIKGGNSINRVIVQEGVYSFETMPDSSVVEPVVYMVGQYVIGGFYRVHKDRGADENLNTPGMHFEPLAFSAACNVPRFDQAPLVCENRFYVYGVIARLAALAAAREIEAL